MRLPPKRRWRDICNDYGTRKCVEYRRQHIDRFPLLAEDISRGYVLLCQKEQHGYRNANRWLAHLKEWFVCGPWNVTHDDDALIEHAKAQAHRIEKFHAVAYSEEVKRAHFTPRTVSILTQVASPADRGLFMQRLAHLHRLAGVKRAVDFGSALCDDHQIEPPKVGSLTSRLARLTCDKWWRRKLRVLSGRRIEQFMRVMGRVHKRAGIYASDLLLARRRQQKARNAALLEAFFAINQHGEQYSLAELSELGIANPSHRYAEMMLRIRDTEAVALRRGDKGLFFTWTCPSKYHPVHSKSCKENRKYQGDDPREAHRYLTKLWARVRAKFKRDGTGVYGMRVVEPHHDGTPHWHLMIWCSPASVDRVIQVMREYALKEDGDERGADMHRFKVERIVQSKGGAISYLAKYVGKGVNHTKDGDLDQYGNDMATAAMRIEAWAANWNIRQFQFFGLPSVTAWRELRKITDRTRDDHHQWELQFGYEPATREFTQRLVAACDSGQWDQFVQLMGGPMRKRDERPVSLWTINRHDTDKDDAMARGRYGDKVKVTYGVTIMGCEYLTKFNRWEVKHKNELPITEDDMSAAESGMGFGGKRAEGSPWIHVNNCTRPFGKPGASRQERMKIMSQNRWNELPPDQAAKKIDDWLIDSAHMQRIMIRKPLNDDEKRRQARNFNSYITSSEYQAELEHRREVDQQIREYCSG